MILDNNGVIQGLKEYKEKWAIYKKLEEELHGKQITEPLIIDHDGNLLFENPATENLSKKVAEARDYFNTLHEAMGGVDISNQTAIIGVYIYGRDKKEIAKKINVEVSEMDDVLKDGIEELKNELLNSVEENMEE